ncbi:hypothetical protein EVAR_22466_1 [Eumeta japonica]|uniref:Uncharacterized protein n=1 Tax=Eumeta variegata TaxID=151549 RepID=A0A4C1VEE7_EUMVA|nr:hypothetical protein EVAR_22466_1 [Eumeta japonica]
MNNVKQFNIKTAVFVVSIADASVWTADIRIVTAFFQRKLIGHSGWRGDRQNKMHIRDARAQRTASADWWITPGTAGMRSRDLFTTSRDYRESVGVIFH